MKFLCRINWHAWDAWTRVSIKYYDRIADREYTRAEQEHECRRCGLVRRTDIR